MQSPVNRKIPTEALEYLSSRDRVLKEMIVNRGQITFPVFEDHFYSLVMSVVYQQLSFKAAETIFGRLLHRVDHSMDPEVLNILEVEDYRSLGISRQKANYILDICRHFTESPEKFEKLEKLPDSEAVELLCRIKGIGQWTAQMFLMFTLERPDIFPVGDLGIRKAISKLYEIPIDAPLPEFEGLAAQWAPYRSFACHYLWHMHDA